MLSQAITPSQTLKGETVYSFAAAPRAGSPVHFAACGGGLYRSSGEGWEKIQLPGGASSQLACTALAIAPDSTVYAAVQGGILRSSDLGGSWHTAPFPAPPPIFSCLALSPNFTRDGLMLAGTLEDGVFSSDDRGLNWKPWNFGLFDLRVLCLAVSPNFTGDETVYAGTETGLYRSRNGGRAWRVTDFPSDLAPLPSLAMATASDGHLRIVAGTEDQGLLLSDDGDSWRAPSCGNSSGAVNQLQATATGALYAMTNDSLLRSRDAGESWQPVYSGDAALTAMLVAEDEKSLLLGALDAGVQRFWLD